MAMAGVGQQVTFVSADAMAENYFARVPLAHAVFRSAELWMLEEASLERPVLDVGCGRGEFATLALHGVVDAGVDLVARDLDSARRTGCYRQLCQADARHLPYPDDAFRSVLSISVLEHVQQPDLAVREIYRVLAPGGLFVATVVLKDIHDHLAIARAFRRYGLAALADAYFRVHDRLFRHVSLFPQRQWEELLSEAGFEPVRTSRVVSRRVVRWWEGLMWLAWPYRVWRCAGNLLARKPRWLARWLNRRFERLLREEDDEGACLFIVAQKPHGASNAEVRAEPDWERARPTGDENQAVDPVSVCRGSRGVNAPSRSPPAAEVARFCPDEYPADPASVEAGLKTTRNPQNAPLPALAAPPPAVGRRGRDGSDTMRVSSSGQTCVHRHGAGGDQETGQLQSRTSAEELCGVTIGPRPQVTGLEP